MAFITIAITIINYSMLIYGYFIIVDTVRQVRERGKLYYVINWQISQEAVRNDSGFTFWFQQYRLVQVVSGTFRYSLFVREKLYCRRSAFTTVETLSMFLVKPRRVSTEGRTLCWITSMRTRHYRCQKHKRTAFTSCQTQPSYLVQLSPQ